MKLKKILNNNAVLVIDGNEEKVAVGTGIAFGKKKNDLINKQKIEKLFIMKENEKLQQLLSRISEEHFIISEEIISYAEKTIGMKLSEHIHITLTDHVSFSIERIQNGMHLKNKLLNEIKILYKEEFEIGLWALDMMKEKLNIEMPIDEAAFIALHIHTMKLSGGNYKETLRQTTIVSEMIQRIVSYLGLEIEEDDISYQRLITHLRFVLHRVKHSDQYSMDLDMLTMIKHKFAHSYQCAEVVSKEIAAKYDIEFPESELGYIAIHLERLRD
ncbi:PRD domain-containing protein [Paraliobacillus salinarum]|uniref:PRD domain-containing protein n=1 Tax=Paraliobacillus salinarum TaxID=1158996 RepID=UPI0015F391D9|nr:PRD domain-containing protein [Paraliobacillus salinarum]